MKHLLILFSLIVTSLIAQPFPKTSSLDGQWAYHIQHLPKSNYHLYHFGGDEPTMQLPANWYKRGLNHAGIVWFERHIHTKDLPTASHHFLEFTGVDYLCDIWVNDTYIGSHEGYFQTFAFDISQALKVGVNRIKVKVTSPLENYPEHYSLHKTLLRGIFAHHDTRPGGAWSPEGQDKNSGGIWNHIAIKSYQNYRLDKLKATPTINPDSVDLHLDFLLKQLKQPSQSSLLYYKALPKAKEIKVTLTPSNFKGKSFTQSFPLTSKKEAINLTMRLEDAKLWYTHDRGYPHLYHLTIQVGQTVFKQQLGFKSLTQDAHQTHYLNGTKLYLKGTNYISSQYMSEMDTERLKADLLLMKKAHINTIRVHAHIEPKRFYTLCDEMGFLVWQDYNLQWGYIDTQAFQDEAIHQAKEMVDMLYNHPSIYLWSMHNEPPWNSDWMKWKYPDYNANINKVLDEKLYQAIKAYDTHHLIKKLSSNLEHPWFGWYSGRYQDFANPSKVPVVSEYGAQAIPQLSSIQKFIPQKYLAPVRKKAKKHWEYHNYQFNWNEKNGIKYQGDIKQLISTSQNYQAQLIKYATEMLRIQKYQGTTAIFQFMFNEGWPSINWGIVDYYRNEKLGYKALQKAFAPLLLVTKQDPDNTLTFYVVNDTLKPINHAKLKISLSTSKGTKVYYDTVNIQSDSVAEVSTLMLEENATIDMRLTTKAKEVHNHYKLTYLPLKKRNDE